MLKGTTGIKLDRGIYMNNIWIIKILSIYQISSIHTYNIANHAWNNLDLLYLYYRHNYLKVNFTQVYNGICLGVVGVVSSWKETNSNLWLMNGKRYEHHIRSKFTFLRHKLTTVHVVESASDLVVIHFGSHGGCEVSDLPERSWTLRFYISRNVEEFVCISDG